jgi:hypothetical protein
VQTKDGNAWEQSFGPNSSNQVGTFDYNITSTGTGSGSSGATTYTGVHGTFTGTLPVLGGTLSDGGTADANLQITF